jgi:hypothetical protein
VRSKPGFGGGSYPATPGGVRVVAGICPARVVQRAAHAHVVERRALRVDPVVVDGHLGLVLEVRDGRQQIHRLGGQVGVLADEVELARAVQVERGRVALDRQRDDAPQLHRAHVPVTGVALEDHAPPERPLDEPERSVRHDALRLRPLLRHAVALGLLDGPARHRPERVQRRDERQEVRDRIDEVDDQRVVIGGPHADVVRRPAPLVTRLPAREHEELRRVARRRARIEHALPGPLEVVGRDRSAVAPARIGPQVKDPPATTLVLLPPLGHARQRLHRHGVRPRQAFEDVVDDRTAHPVGAQARVDVLGLPAVVRPEFVGRVADLGGAEVLAALRQARCSEEAQRRREDPILSSFHGPCDFTLCSDAAPSPCSWPRP